MWETIDKCHKHFEVIFLIHRRSTVWTIAAPVFENKRLQNCCLSCSSWQMSVYLTLELAFVWEECFLLFCSVWSCRKLAWGCERRGQKCVVVPAECACESGTGRFSGRGVEGTLLYQTAWWNQSCAYWSTSPEQEARVEANTIFICTTWCWGVGNMEQHCYKYLSPVQSVRNEKQ